MLILHTADLHLTSKDRSRIEILEWIINKGNEKKVDMLVIAGDLFDSDTESTILRPEVRRIFEKSRAKIFLLPGNHDAESYGLNYDYGENVKQLTEKPYTQLTLDDIKIVAVPYQKAKFSECILELAGNIDILIAHGTIYDISILPVLNEEDTEYMPIYPAEIENFARCILMGHIHSEYIGLTFKNTKVVYAGAPAALNTKCRSPRKVAMIEVDRKKVEIVPVEIDIAPYWQRLSYYVFPGNEEKILDRLEQDIRSKFTRDILLDINITGYIEGDENEFKNRIRQIVAKYKGKFSTISVDYNYIHSWDRLLKNSFVKKFIEKTAQLDDRLRMKIYELTFPHLDELLK
ncbi:MAG: metallophosphoesterase [candidate division WOR-3 bacterium]|nr:metallophosphoesterase [candidate division WOR-3 bacterium]